MPLVRMTFGVNNIGVNAIGANDIGASAVGANAIGANEIVLFILVPMTLERVPVRVILRFTLG